MKYHQGILILTAAAILIPSACRDKGDVDNRPAKMPDAGEAAVKDSDFINLEEAAAATLAKKRGLTYRIISVNGEPRPMTMDLRHDRVNFEMQQGRVVKVTRG